jgi:hypothetical protein
VFEYPGLGAIPLSIEDSQCMLVVMRIVSFGAAIIGVVIALLAGAVALCSLHTATSATAAQVAAIAVLMAMLSGVNGLSAVLFLTLFDDEDEDDDHDDRPSPGDQPPEPPWWPTFEDQWHRHTQTVNNRPVDRLAHH